MMPIIQLVFSLLGFREMGLWWIFAYGVVFVLVRRIVVFLETGRMQQRVLPVAVGGFFALLLVVMYPGWPVIARWFGPAGDAAFLAVFWGFVCTVWAALDGVFVLYMLRIHGWLAGTLAGHSQPSVRRGIVYREATAWWLGAVFAAGYLLYFARVLAVARVHALDGMELMSLSFFFSRICGVFWVLFEGILAVMLFRIYRLLKRAYRVG